MGASGQRITIDRDHITTVLETRLCCVECGHSVRLRRFDDSNACFLCTRCGNIHLERDGIWIFLPDSHEDPSAVEAFLSRHADTMDRELRGLFEQKMHRIAKNTKATWEDEDTKHWDENYILARQHAEVGVIDPSTYSRDIHLLTYVRRNGIDGKILCEIGAGTADAIRKLLSPLSLPYYYVPTDYSFEALILLRRTFGRQNNIQCIQCMGNRLPFHEDSIDYIFSLGVLHHMPDKEGHIDQIMTRVKPGGLFLFYEAYERGTRLSQLFFRYGKYLVEPRQSAHEERINRWGLERIMERYSIVHYAHEYSPFLTLAMMFYNKLRISNLTVLKAILFVDQIVIGTIGRVFKTFSSGACFGVLRKEDAKSDSPAESMNRNR